MSINAIGQPGFGIGARFGVPVTVGCASSTSVSITGTAFATTQYVYGYDHATAPNVTDITFIRLQAVSTGGGVTGTYDISFGAGATFWNDNQSFRVNNTSSVSVNVVLIPA